jgi:hypothetical protein
MFVGKSECCCKSGLGFGRYSCMQLHLQCLHAHSTYLLRWMTLVDNNNILDLIKCLPFARFGPRPVRAPKDLACNSLVLSFVLSYLPLALVLRHENHPSRWRYHMLPLAPYREQKCPLCASGAREAVPLAFAVGRITPRSLPHGLSLVLFSQIIYLDPTSLPLHTDGDMNGL